MAKPNRRTLFHRLFSPRRSRAASAGRTMIGVLESRTYLTTTFSGPTNFPGITSPTAIAVADFTSGTPGVAVEGYAPSSPTSPVVGVYLQSSGSFGTPTINPFGSLTGATASGVAAGDFLNNGDQDIAALDSSTNTLNVFLNDVQGDFSPGAGASLGGTPGDTALATADFNGDGKLDIAAVDPNDNQVVTFLSTTEGAFVAGATISIPSPIGVVAADFNGDNHPDLAILSSDGSVYIAINNGSGGFDAPVPYSLGAAGADPDSMVVGDLVSGGAPDLAVIGSTTAGGPASAIVLLNNGDGAFGAASVVGSVPTNPLSILAGNFTGSGLTDLAVLDAEGGLTVIPGNGDGTFGAAVNVPLGSTPAAVAADDFNNDGGTDFATASSSGNVTVALQQSADISVTLNSSPTVTLGSNLIYTETVTNSGPGTAINLMLNDQLPTGATLVSATTSQGTVDTTNSGEADVALGNLASGASATVKIVVRPTGYGTLSNSVSINADSVDPNYENNYAEVDTPVVGTSGAEVAVAVTGGNYFARVGDNITDTFTITNNGPASASGITFTNSLPAGVTYVSSSISQGTITSSSATTVTAGLGDLADGASATVAVTFEASTTGQYTDTATVAANPSTDPYTADNTATANTYAYGQNFPGTIPSVPISTTTGVPTSGTPTGTYTLPAPTSGSGSSTAAGPAGALPALSISNVEQTDVTRGTTNFTFTVTRSGNLNSASSVHYQTVSGTAKSGIAFHAASGELSLAAGVAQAAVTVVVNGSKTYLPNRSFVVELSGAQNAALQQSRGTGTIVSGVNKKTKSAPHSKPHNPAAGGLNINFEPIIGPVVPGYLEDTGLAYGSRANGFTYGWSSLNTANAVTRSGVKDPRYATFNLLGSPGASNWQIALPDGKYTVHIAAGDSTISTGIDAVDANGAPILNGGPKPKHPFVSKTATVSVTAGVLTFTDASSTPVPLDFVKIKFKG